MTLWIDAFACATFPVWAGYASSPGGNASGPGATGVARNVFNPGYVGSTNGGVGRSLLIFLTGVVYLLAAPWATRLLVYADRHFGHVLVGPDAVTARVRATLAIEAIAFSGAGLLANVAQHARASRAAVTCAQPSARPHVAVRDDGVGGARLPEAGSHSSGLKALTERVRAVDGYLHLVSRPGGPSVTTIDLPPRT